MLTYGDTARMEALARRHPKQIRIVDARKSYVPLGEDPVKTPAIAETGKVTIADAKSKVDPIVKKASKEERIGGGDEVRDK